MNDVDLFVLAADLDTANALEGLLSRPRDLGIGDVTFDVRRHPGRDGGCRTGSVEFLRPYGAGSFHAAELVRAGELGSVESERRRFRERRPPRMRVSWERGRLARKWDGKTAVERCGRDARVPRTRRSQEERWASMPGRESGSVKRACRFGRAGYRSGTKGWPRQAGVFTFVRSRFPEIATRAAMVAR